MPYCPKCDMEFVDGITVCSDCGGPLYESEEAARAARKPEIPAGPPPAFLQEEAEQEAAPLPCGVYVRKSQKYEDLKSSAAAFLLIGALLAAASLLLWTGVVLLPSEDFPALMFKMVLTLLGLGSLTVSVLTYRSAGNMRGQIQQEETRTKELIEWFTSAYSGEDLDRRLCSEYPDLTDGELSLKRFELIQDLLITSRDLSDQGYVDSLCEEIYGILYE